MIYGGWYRSVHASLNLLKELKKNDIMLDFIDNWSLFRIEFNKSKKDGKDQEPIQSSTTPDLGYYVGK